MQFCPMSITLKQALDEMKSCTRDGRKSFEIEFVSFDRRRGSKGLLVKKLCRIIGNSNDAMKNDIITFQPAREHEPSSAHVGLIMKLNGEFIEG